MLVIARQAKKAAKMRAAEPTAPAFILVPTASTKNGTGVSTITSASTRY